MDVDLHFLTHTNNQSGIFLLTFDPVTYLFYNARMFASFFTSQINHHLKLNVEVD